MRGMGQELKVEHINDGLAGHETLGFYRQGEFVDLCRGPHVPHTGQLKAVKLLSVAGAHWKGDQSNRPLQRLYGTAFFDKKQLKAYLAQVEEAKKRDHRAIGKRMDLFTIDPEVGQGLVMWLPKGATLRYTLESFLREELIRRGYEPVYSPHIGSVKLYETSGHFPYYRDSQFPPFYNDPLTQNLSEILRDWLAVEWSKEQLERDKQKLKNLQAELEELSEFGKLPESITNDVTALDQNILRREASIVDDENNVRDRESELLPKIKESSRTVQDQALAEQLRTYDLNGDKARVAILANVVRQTGQSILKPMNCPHHAMMFKARPRSYKQLPVPLRRVRHRLPARAERRTERIIARPRPHPG